MKTSMIGWACAAGLVAGCQSTSMKGLGRLSSADRDPVQTVAGSSSASRNSPGLPGPSNRSAQAAGNPVQSFAGGEAILRQYYSDLNPATLEQARVQFAAASQADPTYAPAQHRLAIVADLQEQFPQAENYYLNALSLDPRNANICADLGFSYLLQRRWLQAENYLNQALQIDPAHDKAAEHLAVVYGQQGKFQMAESTLMKAMPPQQAQARFAALFPDRAKAAAGTGTLAPATRNDVVASDRNPQAELLAKMEQARVDGIAARQQAHALQASATTPAAEANPGITINAAPSQAALAAAREGELLRARLAQIDHTGVPNGSPIVLPTPGRPSAEVNNTAALTVQNWPPPGSVNPDLAQTVAGRQILSQPAQQALIQPSSVGQPGPLPTTYPPPGSLQAGPPSQEAISGNPLATGTGAGSFQANPSANGPQNVTAWPSNSADAASNVASGSRSLLAPPADARQPGYLQGSTGFAPQPAAPTAVQNWPVQSSSAMAASPQWPPPDATSRIQAIPQQLPQGSPYYADASSAQQPSGPDDRGMAQWPSANSIPQGSASRTVPSDFASAEPPNPSAAGNWPAAANVSPAPDATFDNARRRAALMGLGVGPGQMFPALEQSSGPAAAQAPLSWNSGSDPAAMNNIPVTSHGFDSSPSPVTGQWPINSYAPMRSAAPSDNPTWPAQSDQRMQAPPASGVQSVASDREWPDPSRNGATGAETQPIEDWNRQPVIPDAWPGTGTTRTGQVAIETTRLPTINPSSGRSAGRDSVDRRYENFQEPTYREGVIVPEQYGNGR